MQPTYFFSFAEGFRKSASNGENHIVRCDFLVQRHITQNRVKDENMRFEEWGTCIEAVFSAL